MSLQEAFSPDGGLPAIIAALAICTLGGVLSTLVVLKRLAFIGQGISHAAFGGVGVALMVGLTGGSVASNTGQIAVVLGFSIAAALWIAHLAKKSSGGSDTAIGVVLSVSMAIGFILVQIASARFEQAHAGHDHSTTEMAGHEDAHHAIEEVLFGDILQVSWLGAIIAVAAMLLLLSSAWWMRRKLVLWGYDEPVCEAFGVDADKIRRVFFVLLAVSIVVAMQLAGVVLAAAIFVLPGASALNISGRLRPVVMISTVLAVLAAVGGLILGFSTGWPIGPCIVAVQGVVFGITLAARGVLR